MVELLSSQWVNVSVCVRVSAAMHNKRQDLKTLFASRKEKITRSLEAATKACDANWGKVWKWWWRYISRRALWQSFQEGRPNCLLWLWARNFWITLHIFDMHECMQSALVVNNRRIENLLHCGSTRNEKCILVSKDNMPRDLEAHCRSTATSRYSV